MSQCVYTDCYNEGTVKAGAFLFDWWVCSAHVSWWNPTYMPRWWYWTSAAVIAVVGVTVLLIVLHVTR